MVVDVRSSTLTGLTGYSTNSSAHRHIVSSVPSSQRNSPDEARMAVAKSVPKGDYDGEKLIHLPCDEQSLICNPYHPGIRAEVRKVLKQPDYDDGKSRSER